MAKKALPKVLYVRRDEEDNNSYFIADEGLDDVVQEHGTTIVGKYELKATKTYSKVVYEVN